MSPEIKRMLGIGQGTLADKERDYQARHTVKSLVPIVEMRMINGIWFIVRGVGMRHATMDEIKRYAPVTIMDNGDD
jgi:hypothetical protein